jgi:penicillin amidase
MDIRQSWHQTCLVLFVSFICGCSSLNHYQKEEDLRLVGLSDPVTFMQDEKRMAYIYANPLEDAIVVQGFVAVQDRLFNMELIRMFAAGRIAELAREEAVGLDTRTRTIGLYRHAKRQAPLLDPV